LTARLNVKGSAGQIAITSVHEKCSLLLVRFADPMHPPRNLSSAIYKNDPNWPPTNAMSMPRAIPPNKANPVSVRWAPDQGSKTAASARSPPHAIRKSGFDQTGNSGRRVHDHSYL